MSRDVPDRNVTHRCLQSGGGRARSPDTAQSVPAMAILSVMVALPRWVFHGRHDAASRRM